MKAVPHRRIVDFSLRKSELVLPFPWSRNESAPGFDGSGREKERQRKFRLRGPRNPLKRLNSAKEIKGNQSLFL
jgi:hypothetical protein